MKIENGIVLKNDYQLSADELAERIGCDECCRRFMDDLANEFGDEVADRLRFGLALAQVGPGKPIPTPPNTPVVHKVNRDG